MRGPQLRCVDDARSVQDVGGEDFATGRHRAPGGADAGRHHERMRQARRALAGKRHRHEVAGLRLHLEERDVARAEERQHAVGDEVRDLAGVERVGEGLADRGQRLRAASLALGVGEEPHALDGQRRLGGEDAEGVQCARRSAAAGGDCRRRAPRPGRGGPRAGRRRTCGPPRLAGSSCRVPGDRRRAPRR